MNAPLTRTELETLAVMLGSASRHMNRARTSQGKLAWLAPAVSEAQGDMFEAFYVMLQGNSPRHEVVKISG